MAKKAYVNDGSDWVELASASTDLTNYATKTYADTAASTAVSNVIDSSPNTLDTLNELAAALGDDPNFATTITSLIAEKMSNVPGMISQYAGATSPNGWMICDGSAVSRTTYSALYSAIGNSYGSGDGSTTFNLPNLRGAVPVGRDSAQTEFDTLGEIGGAKTHSLTEAQMPSHSHTGNSGPVAGGLTLYPSGTLYEILMGTAAGANRLFYSRNGDANNGVQGMTPGINAINADHSNNFTTNPSGSGEAHNNLQPYIVVNYIIKF